MDRKCAIWARASTAEQTNQSQLAALRALAERRGLTVSAVFETEDSGWTRKGTTGKGAEFDARRAELLAGAWRGDYQYVLCWSIDRVSRRGAEDMFAFMRRLTERGCALVSLQEDWVENLTDEFIRPIILAVYATVAEFESRRRSERVKLAMARPSVKANMKGRKPRGKDKSRRSSEGYRAAWSPERRAAAAERARQQHAARRELDISA